MPRSHPLFSNFTAGELSPLLDCRLDFAKYANGGKRVENWVIRPHGPLVRRPGTHFVAEVKDSTKKVRVLPFQFSIDQAYIIEFGPGWFRFYKDAGRIESPPGTPVEVANTYLEDELFDVQFFQNADTLYLCHKNHPVRKVTRSSHTSWALTTVNFLPPATVEDGEQPATTLTLSATSGLNITLTAGAAAFHSSDVGRMVTVGTARAIIRSYTSTTVVNADVVDTFASVGPHSSGTWTLQGSPNATLTPSAAGPIHAIVTLTTSVPADGFRSATDVGRYVLVNKGVCRIIEVTAVSTARAEILYPLTNTTASPGGSWTIESAAWSTSYGYPVVGTFFEQRMVLASTLGTGRGARPQTIWGSRIGDPESFPRSANDDASFEFKVASNQVNVVRWMAPTRQLLLGTADTEMRLTGGTDKPITPTNVEVKSETGYGSVGTRPVKLNNAALHISRSRKEFREFIYNFQTDSYVDNDLLLLAQHLTEDHGLIEADYQRSPHSLVWLIREDGTALSLTYQRDHDVVGWVRHLTGPVEEASSIGPLHAHPLKGFFESVAVIPNPNLNGDAPWFVVRRTLTGGSKRYIEYMDDQTGSYYSLGEHGDFNILLVDSGLIYEAPLAPTTLTLSQTGLGYGVTATASAAYFTASDVGNEIRQEGSTGRATITAFTSSTVVTVQIIREFSTSSVPPNTWLVAVRSFTGLSHLEGETVQILGDGAVYANQVVVGGAVTIGTDEVPIESAEIGLGYTSFLKTMRPEIPLAGTSQGRRRHWAEVQVRLRNTLGGNVMGQDMPFRGSQDFMDQRPPLFNGDIIKAANKAHKDGHIEVYQAQPLTMTIVGIFGTLGTGE